MLVVMLLVLVVGVVTVDLWGCWPNALCPWKNRLLKHKPCLCVILRVFPQIKKKLKLLMGLIKFLNIGLYFFYFVKYE